MYLYLSGNKVTEIIPERNPAFPGIPIEKRYPQSYISNLTYVPDDTVVGLGWTKTSDGFIQETEEAAPSIVLTPEPTLRDRVIELENDNATLSVALDLLTIAALEG